MRLVNSGWDETVLTELKRKENVRISIYELRKHIISNPNEISYFVKDLEELLALIDRHEKAQEFCFSYMQNVRGYDYHQAIITKVSTYRKLKRLVFENFRINEQIFKMLQELVPQVTSQTFIDCGISAGTLSHFGDHIREITIKNCEQIQAMDLLRMMNMIFERGIPLESLVLSCSNHIKPNFLPLTTFMLENFPSLRNLSFSGRLIILSRNSPNPLNRMVATRIEKLRLGEMDWPSHTYQKEFFRVLLARPLPLLTIFHYMGSNIGLNAEITNDFWAMCPRLNKMFVQQVCEDPRCLDAEYQCVNQGHVVRLFRPN